ncbi:Gfo/Idh/MocA family protein [Spongiimicrobium sp. 3-5]|uniref:Gfo/Idh/MocA family protein n=1 Tax=Spongiimicrobium sp. 3-5 TaxID=3332596 RepID=UPI00397F0113
MTDKIRWGIIGLGNIAHHFAKDLSLVTDGQLVAVASRNLEKAKEFGTLYGSDHMFGSYDELFQCEDVDVVYIATPHTSHAALSIAAMQHGKHVLCEKPIGINGKEVDKMILTANEQRVFLMEALWSRFNPTIQSVKHSIEVAGAIGEIKYLHADFAFPALDRDREGRLLNPALGGGSLLDIGIYPIFLAYLLLGKPKTILASASFYETGIESQTSMIFSYEGAQALLYSGLTSKSEMKAEISGENGTIFINPRWHESSSYSLEKDGELTHFDTPPLGKGYTHEIIEVHQCLRDNKLESELWSHQNSRDLVQLLDEVRKQVGVVFPFE